MTFVPRQIVQPGPQHPVRIESAIGQLRTVDFAVTPGLSLVDAVAGPMAAAGVFGGAVDLAGLHLAPFDYVIPSRSPDADHVAFYSETRREPGGVRIECGTATFGRRDGAPFLHAHAQWRGASGMAAGHILPLDTRIATTTNARAWGVADAEFRATADAETNFSLFGPLQITPAAGRCVLARLRPGEDLVLGVEALCRRYGAVRATLLSCIGSTAGSLLETGARIDTVPTEFFAPHGTVGPDGHGHARAEIDLVVVDEAGTIVMGRPVRGMNPVLICAEIVLLLTDQPAGDGL